jgi:serine phosphatase RsbU (regulator of sigma subunit)/anti-sigma regulatory factor (Ser/Thr protein kinase)
MDGFMRTLAHAWRRLLQRATPGARNAWHPPPRRAASEPEAPIDIAPDDPILAHFHGAVGAVDLDTLELESPARAALLAAGMQLVVPLVSQGELLGLLSLGPRLSEQDYSREDRKLLESLAARAALAVRIAQLVRRQAAEVRTRERIEQELQVARVIQQYFLPKAPPDLPGWQLAAHYRPARAVGGDFYDFIPLPTNKLGLVIGDVTDKGVPAALLMAATRSVLRASAQRLVAPDQVLGRVNELMVPDTPPHMFVTCLYAVLDPASGRLCYANAGHDAPYLHTADGEAVALQARGLPLGVMSGITYERHETWLKPGQHVLLYSDGLVEAHDPRGEMFSFERLAGLMADHVGGPGALIERLLAELDRFVGPGWEQEDDVTLVSLRRAHPRRVLCAFTLPSQLGNERLAIERLVQTVDGLEVEAERLERLKSALAEATINAIEHGNHNQPELPVSIRVLASDTDLCVTVGNPGGQQPSLADAPAPDLEAKLAGRQPTRGWGRFLIQRLVDDVRVTTDNGEYTVELIVHLG